MPTEPKNRERFLTAEWRHLVMLNYIVDRAPLEPLVPPGTLLDTYKGNAYVTVVAFRFLNTRVFGVPIPFHQDFEEVNLRFYVRRFDGNEWRRGVVFIREIVPKAAVAFVAQTFYNENYVSLPMRHEIATGPDGTFASAIFHWKSARGWNHINAKVAGPPRDFAPASPEEFITEHYWGYVRQKDGSVMEYEVEHPRWRIWPAHDAILDCDSDSLSGQALAVSLAKAPASAFVAEGSPVTVFKGVRLPAN